MRQMSDYRHQKSILQASDARLPPSDAHLHASDVRLQASEIHLQASDAGLHASDTLFQMEFVGTLHASDAQCV